MLRPRTDAAKLKLGEYLSDIQYYKIIQINTQTVTVINERGFESESDIKLVNFKKC